MFKENNTSVERKIRFNAKFILMSKMWKKITECRACNNFARLDTVILKDENGKIIKDKTGKSKKMGYHDQFCLEHCHEMPNFEKMDMKINEPSEYKKVYEYKSPNLAKTGKMALCMGGGAVVCGPLFYVAAPAIGGAIGSAIGGYSGAAATSYGLALLGGGALAAGGFGMAGGMVVATAAGVALGSGIGAYIGNSYLADIDGFDIKKSPRSGVQQPTIITVNGLFSEEDKNDEKGYKDWEKLISEKYSGHEWYHVYWESKRLHDMGSLIAQVGGAATFGTTVTLAAKKATKEAAKKLGPAATALTIIPFSKNPWHVAMVKAEKTGVLLADILTRTSKKYVLLGHSLGARAIYSTLRQLEKAPNQIIEDVHLLGGAVDNDSNNWKVAKKAVKNQIWNYYSNKDKVLSILYKPSTLFTSTPIGTTRIEDVVGIRNKDVSKKDGGHMEYKKVGGHMEYKRKAHLFVEM